MAHAVINSGGKQYLVSDGERIRVAKIKAKTGENITLDQILLVSTGKTIKIGQPTLEGASVAAKIVAQGKTDKIYGAKVKGKKRYRKYFGHRQDYTDIEITAIKSK